MLRTTPHRVAHLALILALAAPHAGLFTPSSASATARTKHPQPSAALRLTAPQPAAPDAVIMRFEGDTVPVAAFKALRAAGVPLERTRPQRRNVVLVDAARGEDVTALSRRLSALPGVTWATPDYQLHPAENVPPSDPAWNNAIWPQSAYLGARVDHAWAANVEPLWDRLFNGAQPALPPDRTGVAIAVLDTGYSPTLREDAGAFIPIADLANGDSNPADDDPYLHGTRVASILRAETDNAYGMAGTLHKSRSKVLVYKCMRRITVIDPDTGVPYPTSTGDASDFLFAMMDAADRGAKVINISAAMPTLDRSGNPLPASAYQPWIEAAEYCADRGALVVAAAGNNDPGTPLDFGGVALPAATPDSARPMVIAVGSYDHTSGGVSNFSNTGPQLDLSAPGNGIWTANSSDFASPYVPDTTQKWSGTSFAAPIVSATAALIYSLAPGASPRTVIDALHSGATDAGAPGRDSSFGWGRMDALAAYHDFVAAVPQMTPVTVSATTPQGFFTRLSWSGGSGLDRTYRYGVIGGPDYLTRSAGATICLPGEGTWTVRVFASAPDRLSRDASTLSVTVGDTRAPLATTRAEGADRYATAAAASRSAFSPGVPSVVIASGENWPDALCAAPLATALDGPVLLTRATKLPADTRDELLRLRPGHVSVIGGTGAVSAGVSTDISRLLPTAAVERIYAQDRYGTAAAIAARVGAAGGRAMVASGETYADALSGAPVAAANGWPILLTRRADVPAATLQAVTALGVSETFVLGGTGAVSHAAEARLPGPVRLAGADRWDTSRAVAAWGFDAGLLEPGSVGLATGLSFPDALAAGPVLAITRGPVLLADATRTGAAVNLLGGEGESMTALRIFGGSSAVTYATELLAQEALRP